MEKAKDLEVTQPRSKKVRRDEQEGEGITSTETTTPEKTEIGALKNAIIQAIITSDDAIISEVCANAVADYLIEERNCQLGENPILLVNVLPALSLIVSQCTFERVF